MAAPLFVSCVAETLADKFFLKQVLGNKVGTSVDTELHWAITLFHGIFKMFLISFQQYLHTVQRTGRDGHTTSDKHVLQVCDVPVSKTQTTELFKCVPIIRRLSTQYNTCQVTWRDSCMSWFSCQRWWSYSSTSSKTHAKEPSWEPKHTLKSPPGSKHVR